MGDDRDTVLLKLLEKIEQLEARVLAKEQELQQRQLAPAPPPPPAPSDPTVEELWIEFLPHLRAVFRRSWSVAKANMRPILDFPVEGFGDARPIGKFRVSELCPALGDAYKLGRTTRGRIVEKNGRRYEKPPVQGNTVNREMNTVQSVITWHTKNGRRLSHNPLHGWEREDERKYKRKTEMSLEKFQRFIAHGHPVMQDIATVSFLCYGLRPGEALWLQKSWLNVDEKEIQIPRPKNGVPRKVPVADQAWEILMRRSAESRGPYVFVRPTDPTRRLPIPRETMQGWVVKCRRLAWEREQIKGDAGERLVAYHWRHAGINQPILEGEEAIYVAEAAGCSVKTMRENYLKFPQAKRHEMRANATRRGGAILPAPAPLCTEPRRPARAAVQLQAERAPSETDAEDEIARKK